MRFLLVLLLLAAPAAAQSRLEAAAALSVEVLPGWRESRATHVAALRVRLRPGWRTYWRRAGEGGISPLFDWRRSRGIAAVEPRWPAPQVFRGAGGVRSIGYVEDFVLPLAIRVARADGRARLRGRLEMGVCREVCLPVTLAVDAALPAGGRPDPAIRAALRDGPRAMRSNARCAVAPTPGGLRVTAALEAPAQGGAEAVVIEPPDPSIFVSDADMRRTGRSLSATADLRGAGLALDRARLRITVIGEDGAVEMVGCR